MTCAPDFLILTPEDSRAVLARNHLGRLAFAHNGVVDIEPLGYVARGDWLFARSAYGTKLEALSHRPFVAFEVDEVDGPFEWRSVVVHGTIYSLPADGAPLEQRERRRAVAALRKAMPGAFTDRDPVPEREFVYGLHIDRVDGRMARCATVKRRPRGPRGPRRAKVPARRARVQRSVPDGL